MNVLVTSEACSNLSSCCPNEYGNLPSVWLDFNDYKVRDFARCESACKVVSGKQRMDLKINKELSGICAFLLKNPRDEKVNRWLHCNLFWNSKWAWKIRALSFIILCMKNCGNLKCKHCFDYNSTLAYQKVAFITRQTSPLNPHRRAPLE